MKKDPEHGGKVERTSAASTQSGSGAAQKLELRGYWYDERGRLMPRLLDAVADCGGWLHEKKTALPDTIEFEFEVRLRSAMDVYGAFISCGLEMSRESHAAMTELCTLRRHGSHGARARLLQVRLEVRFLDGCESEPVMSGIGLA